MLFAFAACRFASCPLFFVGARTTLPVQQGCAGISLPADGTECVGDNCGERRVKGKKKKKVWEPIRGAEERNVNKKGMAGIKLYRESPSRHVEPTDSGWTRCRCKKQRTETGKTKKTGKRTREVVSQYRRAWRTVHMPTSITISTGAWSC